MIFKLIEEGIPSTIYCGLLSKVNHKGEIVFFKLVEERILLTTYCGFDQT